jgi:hypothetical protein
MKQLSALALSQALPTDPIEGMTCIGHRDGSVADRRGDKAPRRHAA